MQPISYLRIRSMRARRNGVPLKVTSCEERYSVFFRLILIYIMTELE
jgi:hypothetical protein